MIRNLLAVIGLAVVVIPVAVGGIWIIDQAAGTGWALPVFAMFALPILALSLRETR